MAATTDSSVTDLFDQAVETFGGMMRAGVKLQEDMTQWWTDAVNQMGSVQEWQKKSSAVVSEAIPTAQKNAEEALRVVDQNYRSSMELLRKAFDSARYESPAEAQARTQELWEEAMMVMRNNVQTMAAANVRAMESWAEFLRNRLDMGRNGGGAKAAAKSGK